MLAALATAGWSGEAAAYWAERAAPRIDRWHAFDWACEQEKIEHRLTKPRCPWTNGQVERMNRTIKAATVKRYHCTSHDELRLHLQVFVDAYNYSRRLKTLRGLTPDAFVCQTSTKVPERFRLTRHTTCRDRTSESSRPDLARVCFQNAADIG